MSCFPMSTEYCAHPMHTMDRQERSFEGTSRRERVSLGEEKLLRRLSELQRLGAKIAVELEKDAPCKGIISRELLELELGALGQDRAAIEKKLSVLKSSVEDSSTHRERPSRHMVGDSPVNIGPDTTANKSSPTRAGTSHERLHETHRSSIEYRAATGQYLGPSGNVSGPQPYSPVIKHEDRVAPNGGGGGGGGGGGRIDRGYGSFFPHGGCGSPPSSLSSTLTHGEGHPHRFRRNQVGSREKEYAVRAAPAVDVKTYRHPQQQQQQHRQQHHDHQQQQQQCHQQKHRQQHHDHHQQRQQHQDQQRCHQQRWTVIAPSGPDTGMAVIGSPRHCRAGANKPIEEAEPRPLLCDFRDRSSRIPGDYCRDVAPGIGTREPAVPQDHVGGAQSGHEQRGIATRDVLRRDPTITSTSFYSLQHATAAEENDLRTRYSSRPLSSSDLPPPPTTSYGSEGHLYRQGPDRSRSFREEPFRKKHCHQQPFRAEERFVKRRPFRVREEPFTCGPGRNWNGIDTGWSMKEGLEDAPARGTFERASESVPVAMAVATESIDGYHDRGRSTGTFFAGDGRDYRRHPDHLDVNHNINNDSSSYFNSRDGNHSFDMGSRYGGHSHHNDQDYFRDGLQSQHETPQYKPPPTGRGLASHGVDDWSQQRKIGGCSPLGPSPIH